MLVPIWVWKFETEEDIVRLRILLSWFPSGVPN